MSILKVKNGTNWDEIPSIKGKSAYQYAVDGGYQGTEQQFAQKLADEYVTDVQIDGTSILNNGVANVPTASNQRLGVVYAAGGGLAVDPSSGRITCQRADNSEIKLGTNTQKPIVPTSQHIASFYGLAKAAGDSTQASSDNAVGTYTEAAKAAIQSMLGTPNKAIIAAEYDATATYALGDVCLHEGQLYECSTAISTAEAWTAAHWTAKTVADEVSELKGDINGKLDAPSTAGTSGQVLTSDGQGGQSWQTPQSGGSVSPYTSNPSALGTASAGSSNDYARGDHVHPMPTSANVGAIASPSSPISGQFLKWNGSAWVASDLPVYSGGVS